VCVEARRERGGGTMRAVERNKTRVCVTVQGGKEKNDGERKHANVM
jgi:hypothetical protein